MMSQQIAEVLKPQLDTINLQLANDQELLAAFLKEAGSQQRLSFGVTSSTKAPFQPNSIVITLESFPHRPPDVKVSIGDHVDTTFSLCAREEDWNQFFRANSELKRPYQSYWGMLRIVGANHPEVCIIGDQVKFAQYARVWRITLDRIRDSLTTAAGNRGATSRIQLPEGEEAEDDVVTGKYVWITHSEYGKVKIFLETSGSGPQMILFLHTAGSDSRQYHTLMNNKALTEKCTMFAFDLPGHGRSSLGTGQILDGYRLTEDSYIESIVLIIQKTKINSKGNLIVCGASMAGHVCIALAIRAQELGIHGAIPCEGCAHLPLPAAIYDMKGNEASILDPEKVCGMIAPTSPEYYKRQIWWQYSCQGVGVFPGDLNFYFRGWDGRSRLASIDTKYCPVYMLTGEYDYSCTTEASKETANGIPGAVFEPMPGLGHFPLTENPKAALPYLLKAIEHIQSTRTL